VYFILQCPTNERRPKRTRIFDSLITCLFDTQYHGKELRKAVRK